MGLLDDLRNEAERIRSEGGRQSDEARREAYYRAKLRPVMLQALDYLNELLEQMRVVRPQVVAQYHLPGYPRPISAVQHLPKLTLDSGDNPRRLSLHIDYLATDLAFSVMSPAKADETRNFLLSGRQVFSDWPLREANGQLVGTSFSVAELTIRATVTILADAENGCLLFHSRNMDDLQVHRDVVRAEEVDPDWLDRLGRFLLGQGHSPAHLELPSENRAAIQQALESEKIQREYELAKADQILEEQLQSERIGTRVKNLLGSIRNRLSSGPNAD